MLEPDNTKKTTVKIVKNKIMTAYNIIVYITLLKYKDILK